MTATNINVRYPLYDMTTLGFHDENFQVIVNGIVNAVQRAHEKLQVGRILINTDVMSALTNIKYVSPL